MLIIQKKLQQPYEESNMRTFLDNEISQVIDGVQLFLNQYITYSNLTTLFDASNEEYRKRVMDQVAREKKEILVSNDFLFAFFSILHIIAK